MAALTPQQREAGQALLLDFMQEASRDAVQYAEHAGVECTPQVTLSALKALLIRGVREPDSAHSRSAQLVERMAQGTVTQLPIQPRASSTAAAECACSICASVRQVEDAWDAYTPSTPYENIVYKGILATETAMYEGKL
jgi:hypothetical protein